MPLVGTAALVNIQQAIGERVASDLDGPVAREPVEIGLQSENAECPRARAAEFENRRHGSLKEPSCRSPHSRILRLAEHRTQSPQCAPMAVFRANVLKPFAVVAEKIPEAPDIGMKCKPEKSQVAAREVEMVLPVREPNALIQKRGHD